MKLLLSLLAVACYGQTTLTLAGLPTNVRSGATITGTISATGDGAANQFTIQASADVTGITVQAGTAATAAGKSVQCGPFSGGQILCLIYGVNQTVIANGQIATFTATVAAKPAANSIPFSLTNLFTSDPTGNTIATTANPLVAVPVLSNCDINGDGLVNQSDLTAEVSAVLAGAGNVTAVQKVIVAMLTGSCSL